MAVPVRPLFAYSTPRPIGAMDWLAMGDLGRIGKRNTPGGGVRYFLDFRPKYRVYSYTSLGRDRPFETEEIARDALRMVRERVAAGMSLELALDAVRARGASHVLRRAEDWLESQARRAGAGEITGGTLKENRQHVRLHWGRWENASVHGISKGMLDDWVVELRGALGPGTTRNVLAGFHGFLRWLEDREELGHMPKFPRVRVPQRAPHILSPAQQDRVLEAISEDRRGIYLALTDLALRVNEARGAYASDYRDGWLHVQRAAKGPNVESPIGPTKTGTTRRLPVSERLSAWIGAHTTPASRLEHRLLFPSPRGILYSHGALWRTWRKACKVAGVPYAPIREGTRHSTATALRRDGHALDAIQRQLGHADVKNTERYSQFHDSALVELVRKRR